MVKLTDPMSVFDPDRFLKPVKGWLSKQFGYHHALEGFNHTSPLPELNPERKQKLLEATSMETSRNTFRTLFDLVGMYWKDAKPREKMIAGTLAVATLGLSYLSVQVLVDFSFWNREFMDIFQNVGAIVLQNTEALTQQVLEANPDLEEGTTAFQEQIGPLFTNLPEMKEQFGEFIKKLTVDFPVIVAKYLATAITATYAASHLSLRWQTWITGKFTNEWLNNKALYKLKHVYNNIDNPDQRIQEDLDSLTGGMVSITTEGLSSAISLASFWAVLYTSMAAFNPAVFGGPDITINGYLAWTAVAYAAVGTGVMALIAKNLPQIFRDKKVADGTFRAGLLSNHTNSEQITLNNGEEIEKGVLRNKFQKVIDAGVRNINVNTLMRSFNAIHANLGSVIPYIAASPLFFSGAITLGAMSQTAYAFRQVENSFSFFMNNIAFFAGMKASIDRLGTLKAAIELSHYETAEQMAKLDGGGSKPATMNLG